MDILCGPGRLLEALRGRPDQTVATPLSPDIRGLLCDPAPPGPLAYPRKPGSHLTIWNLSNNVGTQKISAEGAVHSY